MCIRDRYMGIYFYDIQSRNLTQKLRSNLYRKILYMPAHWFDETANSPGTLSSKLTFDANQVRGLTADCIGIIVASLSAFTCLLYTSPSPRDRQKSRMPSSA
eukprot:TRINITY_DN3460_c0_g1_i9.p3 TRINITY_DN3460_c0_g1~~TRINITY_DN3460_c0_g1_i9.p3  ORF type:complete len:102 (+),score=22.65 TRINITY_DN3460_c0_g1_i9:130-435(+)